LNALRRRGRKKRVPPARHPDGATPRGATARRRESVDAVKPVLRWGVLPCAALLVGCLTVVRDWPVLFGRVPLPAEIVTSFPPWESVSLHGPDRQPPAHAEMGDLVTELYPWKAYTRAAVSGGSLPLWNPHILLGAPFVGDPQTGLFYPLNLVYYALPTPLAWTLSFLLRTVLAGVLAGLLAAALGASRAGALAAAVTFAFCGWVTAFQTRPHLDSVVWLPLVLLGVDRLQRRLDAPSVALAAAAFALPVLAGQPESAAHVTLAGGAFFLYRLALPPADLDRPRRLRFGGLFVASGLLALGLAAVQMLPALEFIGELGRTVSASWGGKPLREIVTFVSRDLGANPSSAGVEIPECSAYAGMLALLIAPFAVFHRNRRDAIFFALLAAAAASIAYGVGPAYALSLRVPILKGIPNWRLLGVADLALAVLAALGLSAAQDRLREARRAPAGWWWAVAAAGSIAAAGVAYLISHEAVPPAGRILSLATVRQPLGSAAFLIAAAALLALALGGRLRPSVFGALAVALCAADLVSASYRFFPFVHPAEIFPAAPTFDFLSRDSEPQRVAAVDVAYGSSFETMYGLESPTGFTVTLRRTVDLLAPLGFQESATGLTSDAILAGPHRLLDLLNVKYLVATTWNRGASALASRPDRFRLVFSDGSVRVFENRTVLPRAFLVPASGARVISEESAQLARVSDAAFEPAAEVVLASAAEVGGSSGAAPAPGRQAAPPRVLERGNRSIRLKVDAPQAGILVLSQAYYPGWVAVVDGRTTPALRVDFGLAGVALAPGAHEVLFRYAPRYLRLGAMLTIASLIGAAACWLVPRRSSDRREAAAAAE